MFEKFIMKSKLYSDLLIENKRLIDINKELASDLHSAKIKLNQQKVKQNEELDADIACAYRNISDIKKFMSNLDENIKCPKLRDYIIAEYDESIFSKGVSTDICLVPGDKSDMVRWEANHFLKFLHYMDDLDKHMQTMDYTIRKK